ncbi:hypothetical protein MD484_g2468, partial [Candolleomyces efflorescens]
MASLSNVGLHHMPYTGLHSLANETLSQVAAYLFDDQPSISNLMLVNKRLSGVCEYVRYTSLAVQGNRGRRMLASLISGSPTSDRYCLTVKRAWFKYWQDAETYLVSALMCEALARMINLISLRIDGHSVDIPHVLSRMDRVGLIRTDRIPLSILGKSTTSGGPYSALSLPNMRNLMISGRLELTAIASHRPLTELTLETVLDYEDLSDILESAENTLLGRSLAVLSLKVIRSIDLGLVLPLVGNAFPNLRCCALEQTAIKFSVSIFICRRAYG